MGERSVFRRPDLELESASGRSQPGPQPGRRSGVVPRLAMNEMTTYRWSLPEDVEGYQAAGVGAIGVCRPKLVEFGEERGIDLLGESGLAVSTLSWAGGFTGTNNQSFSEAMDDALEAVRLAGELRAESVVVVSGARAGHTLNHARRLLLDALKRLGDAAGERGVRLGLQPLHASFFSHCTFLCALDPTLDVLAACDHPHVGMTFDVYHLWQEPRLLERIPHIVPLVHTVKLSDWREPPRSENDRCLPGDGVIPLPEIARAFVQAGYEGHFEIDIWSEELWSSDYDALLRACRARFDALFA